MLILFLTILIFLLFLIIEKIQLIGWINAIPLRIAVTGSRGKSSVVRLLASILREDGIKVLAKTTGAEAKYILPDGSESEIQRRGFPSIIEQVKLLKKAARLKSDCIVAEVMSIHRENHYVESRQILKPHLVIITNVRQDHIDAMGKTKNEIAAVFCLDIHEKSKVFIHEKENNPIFKQGIEKAHGALILVNEGSSHGLLNRFMDRKQVVFSENFDLVSAVSKYLGINQQTIFKGIRKTKFDVGQPKIWIYRVEETNKTHFLVNGFAANDPKSTLQMLSKVNHILPSTTSQVVGLLCLRPDRSDRTLQWIETLKNEASNYFDKVFVAGAHSKIVKRKVAWIDVLKKCSPEESIATILSHVEDQTVIFGFGNIVGTGKQLVEYWNKIGEPYGV